MGSGLGSGLGLGVGLGVGLGIGMGERSGSYVRLTESLIWPNASKLSSIGKPPGEG